MNLQDHYQLKTANWRENLRKNHFRTVIVILLFFLIYCGIGMLADMYLYAEVYPYATLSELFFNLVTFKLFPIVTLILFGVAAISLFITYTLYDKLMLLGTSYHEVTSESQHPEERQLYNVVEEMKIAAGLRYIPKVYIIEADYMNAFASGFSEKSAMVAITRGLMVKLNRDELQAVMAHELSHIRNLDIKLTLTASLLANITVIVLDILFYNAFYARGRREGRSQNILGIVILLLRYLLPIVSVLLTLYLSRTRELMADAGCVELMRTSEPLASALIKIHGDYTSNSELYAAEKIPHEQLRREAYLFDPSDAGIKTLTSINDIFSTHPTLEKRLAALGYKLK